MTGIPRYRQHNGLALLSAGFRPFFLAAAAWSALAIPLWLAMFSGRAAVPSALPPPVWHAHEMVFGYAAAAVAGFLLTAIPNWTGRMPLQGGPLAGLVTLWLVGRLAVALSAHIGALAAAILDLAFPVVFLAVVAREILAGRNWRNLPMCGVLGILLLANLLVHLEALGIVDGADIGNRLGIATLLMLITLIGGRIIPSFTRNWLAKNRPEAGMPAAFGMPDRAALALTGLALLLWVAVPGSRAAAGAALVAGCAQALRLARWRGWATLPEPLVWMLHLGYCWLALGFLLLGTSAFVPLLPATAALHALTAGAIGTMTLAVMTRASLGHTGRALSADAATTSIYALVTAAALLRLLAPLSGDAYLPLLAIAGAAWSGAFGLFVLFYAGPLSMPRAAPGRLSPQTP